MKKIFTILGLFTAFALSNAQTTVLTDDFNYIGALTSNGWISHSGTSNQLSAAGGVLSLVAGNTEDANKAFSASYPLNASVLNKADYSATINVPNATGLTTAGDYFLTFNSNAGATGGTFNARLYIKGSATGYTLGILNNGAGTVTPTYGAEIPYGTPANVLVTYIVDNTIATPTNTATLQINSQTLLSNATGTGTATGNIASVAVRQGGSAASGTGNVSIDNLIARTYANGSLAISDFNKSKSNFVKNTFVKNEEITFGADVKDVKIYTLTGQVVKTATVKDGTALNVAELTKGNYIVTGTVDNQPVSQKILKD